MYAPGNASPVPGGRVVKAVISGVWTAEAWTPGSRSPLSRAFDVAHLLLPHLS